MGKVSAGLTKNGKRRGRPPKYLTEEQIADPSPQVVDDRAKPAPRKTKSDTPFIIEMVLAKHRYGTKSDKELASRMDSEDKSSGHTAKEVAAMRARISRVTGGGIDYVPGARPDRRSISRKTQS